MISNSFRWPVSATRRIAAPAGRVWNAIASPGNLEDCHPFCATNPVTAWPGPDSVDEVHYLNGRVYRRHFTDWIEGTGYDLDIGDPEGPVTAVSWRITEVDGETCELTITVAPWVLQRVPAVIRWIPHLVWLRPRLRSYLNSVVGGFEWVVIRGEPVPRNHFGHHPWYS